MIPEKLEEQTRPPKSWLSLDEAIALRALGLVVYLEELDMEYWHPRGQEFPTFSEEMLGEEF